MERSFFANGCVATDSLVLSLIKADDKWSRALLGQCFCMPDDIKEKLLSGAVEWAVPNKSTIIIIQTD